MSPRETLSMNSVQLETLAILCFFFLDWTLTSSGAFL